MTPASRSTPIDIAGCHAQFFGRYGRRTASCRTKTGTPWTSQSDEYDSVEDLEEHGLYNPFDEDSYNRYLNKLQVDGAFAQEAVVVRDATTNRPDIETTGGLKILERQPASGELVANLGDWVVQLSGSNFILRLSVPTGSLTSNADLLNEPRYVGLSIWMRGLLETGAGFNANNGIPVGAREYSLLQSAGSTTKWKIPLVGWGPSIITVQCNHISGSDLRDRAAIEAILGAEDVTVETSVAAEKPPLGGTGIHSTALRHEFDEGTYIERRGDFLSYHGKAIPDPDTLDDRFTHDTLLGGAYGSVVDFGDLRVDGLNSLLPNLFNTIGVYFNQTSSAAMKLDKPQNLLPPGNAWNLWIHNDSGTNSTITLTIRDRLGIEVAILRPGERIALNFVHRLDGTGEISPAVPFERRLGIHGDVSDTLGEHNYAQASQKRYRVIRRIDAIQGSDLKYRNADAFTIHDAGSYASGAALDTTDMTLEDDTFAVTKPGHLRFEMTVGILSPSSGNIPGGNGLVVFNQSAITNAKTEVARDLQKQIGVTESRSYSAITEIDVPTSGLIIIPTFRYADNSSITFSGMKVTRYSLDMILTQTIRLSYDS